MADLASILARRRAATDESDESAWDEQAALAKASNASRTTKEVQPENCSVKEKLSLFNRNSGGSSSNNTDSPEGDGDILSLLYILFVR
eukprot:242912-Hanusia_phi.AAC.2